MVWKITLANMQGEDMIKGGCKVRRPAMYMYGIPVGEEQRYVQETRERRASTDEKARQGYPGGKLNPIPHLQPQRASVP